MTPNDINPDAPSVGACVTSICHVLDSTQGVLSDSLRKHLEGIKVYLSAAEDAESAMHRNRTITGWRGIGELEGAFHPAPCVRSHPKSDWEPVYS